MKHKTILILLAIFISLTATAIPARKGMIPLRQPDGTTFQARFKGDLNTSAMRTVFLLLAALLSGGAVSLAGLLSFVGLLVPHAVRRVAGGKSSSLIGLCAIYGAGFVCLCDTLARTLFAPYEIPVGIIMAYLGAPFFVFILVRGKGGHGRD